MNICKKNEKNGPIEHDEYAGYITEMKMMSVQVIHHTNSTTAKLVCTLFNKYYILLCHCNVKFL
jgi:hypothetical protein